MTAADLIQFLRQHPKTCGALGLRFATGCAGTPMVVAQFVSLLENEAEPWTDCFRIWLSGAATAKADEMRLGIGHNDDCTRFWFVTADANERSPNYPTRLAATFAAIEAALSKETT